AEGTTIRRERIGTQHLAPTREDARRRRERGEPARCRQHLSHRPAEAVGAAGATGADKADVTSESSVRLAGTSEHPTLTALYQAWGYRAGIAATDVVYVAERSGEIVGIVRRSHEDGLMMLRGLFVRPSAQRSGIGTSLLHALVRNLGERECYCIPFAHLTAFYAPEGFVVMPEAAAPVSLA